MVDEKNQIIPKEEKEKEQEEVKEQIPEKEDLKTLKNKLRKREAEVKLLKKEKEELQDKYLRNLAEMENLKKRLEREKKEFYQYALAELLKELLIVLDDFERALQIVNQVDGKSFREGVEMIYKQYRDFLTKKGVVPMEIKDKKFDPNFHQAFITEEREDVEEPEVGEELLKGYFLHSRVLRPALVKVIIPKKK